MRMKDGNLRFFVDNRKLNTITIEDGFPLARIGVTAERNRLLLYIGSGRLLLKESIGGWRRFRLINALHTFQRLIE